MPPEIVEVKTPDGWVETRIAPAIELRADGEEGEFSGYAVTWDFVDSYRSTFKRGAFAKTLKERGDRVKVKYNHETLIGKSLELKEDSKGLFVRGKLNLKVEHARNTYEFMKDKTLDGLSFAFRTIKDHYEKGVRIFDEVQLFEFGPVDDPASDEAIVLEVRKRPAAPDSNQNRATDFNQTLSEKEARMAFWVAFSALENTLEDIWWQGREAGADSVLGMIDEALSDAHGALLAAAQQHIDVLWTGEGRAAPGNPNQNTLAQAVRDWFAAENQTAESVATSSALTLSEVRSLMRGRAIADKSKLSGLPAEVQTAHQQARIAKFEELCKELRDGMTPAQHQRVSALLSRQSRQPDKPTSDSTEPDVDAFVRLLRESRASIGVSENA